MSGRGVRVDLRAVAVVSIVTIGAAITLLVAAGTTEQALTRIALALAIITLASDLLIALVAHVASAQTEARLAETNTRAQVALARVEERTEEIRGLVRLQGERMLDLIGGRLIESAPEAEKPKVVEVVGQLREQLSEAILESPQGGRAGRQVELERKLDEWARRHAWPTVPAPAGLARAFRAGDSKTAPFCVVVTRSGRGWQTEVRLFIGEAIRLLGDDWPEPQCSGVPWSRNRGYQVGMGSGLPRAT